MIMFLPTVGYFILKAESVYEYGSTFYSTCAVVNAFDYLLIIFYQFKNIQALIRKFEVFIEKRKLTVN